MSRPLLFTSGPTELRHLSIGAWFHFLSKDIGVAEDQNGIPLIRDRSPLQSPLSQSDYGWSRAGFFLTWTSATDCSASSSLTLICFGAQPSLVRRFESMKLPTDWKGSSIDPYSLFAVVLNDLFLQVDGTLWSLASVFRHIELVGRSNIQCSKSSSLVEHRLLMTRKSVLHDPLMSPDFVGMHNVAKHIIFLKEGSRAILATLTAMLREHRRLSQVANSNSAGYNAKETHAALEYQEELFRSIAFRAFSINERMQNIINLVRYPPGQEAAACGRLAVRSRSADVLYLVPTVFQSCYSERQPCDAQR